MEFLVDDMTFRMFIAALEVFMRFASGVSINSVSRLIALCVGNCGGVVCVIFRGLTNLSNRCFFNGFSLCGLGVSVVMLRLSLSVLSCVWWTIMFWAALLEGFRWIKRKFRWELHVPLVRCGMWNFPRFRLNGRNAITVCSWQLIS